MRYRSLFPKHTKPILKLVSMNTDIVLHSNGDSDCDEVDKNSCVHFSFVEFESNLNFSIVNKQRFVFGRSFLVFKRNYMQWNGECD